jgi:hypothetical protein
VRFFNDPESGEPVLYKDLNALLANEWLPGFEHIPDWLRVDLIERDSQLIRAYLRAPDSATIRRELHFKVMARLQSELDNVLTVRREVESNDEDAIKMWYFLKWSIEQMQAVLTSKSIHEGFSKEEYDELMAKHDALHEQMKEIRRQAPGWTSQTGMDRWDSLRLEKAMFDEQQAMQRLNACMFGNDLNEDINLDDIDPSEFE